MDQQLARYAVLRDGRTWDEGVRMVGLDRERDGTLTLACVPGRVDGKPIRVAGARAVDHSGIASGRDRLYVADTAGNRIVASGRICAGGMTTFPGARGGGLDRPCGLAIRGRDLLVADSGHARVLVLRAATLEPRDEWRGPLREPTALAVDDDGCTYVVDRTLRRVMRFDRSGNVDDLFARTAAGQVRRPFSLAIGPHGMLYVSDEDSNAVGRFSASGAAKRTLPPPRFLTGFRPRAIAILGQRLYIADRDSGQVVVFDWVTQAYVGVLPGYQGPITALALASDGTLYVKPGADQTVHRFDGDASYVTTGRLEMRRLDAGEGVAWERVAVEASVPPETTVRLRLFSADRRLPAPAPADWTAPHTEVETLDSLVAAPGPGATRRAGRYVWLRVTLQGDEAGRSSPRIRQVSAETAAESYLEYLPRIYGREDAGRGFLRCFLALFRSEMSTLEHRIDELPRLVDPATGPEPLVPWLADWLAFEAPPGMDANALRMQLLEAWRLHRRRGTAAGLRAAIELETGAHAVVLESFHDRRLWQLGYRSALGFDTGLPASWPDGMVVQGPVPAHGRYAGLTGEYFAGLFRYRLDSRIDPQVDLGVGRPASSRSWVLPVWPPATWPADLGVVRTGELDVDPAIVSVRWTGQIRARAGEIHDFTISLRGGCRLWVDEALVIDNWIDPLDEAQGSVPLSGDRWSTLALEYYGHRTSARVSLAWSAKSQPREVVPADRLYAVLDDNVTLDVQGVGCVPPERAIVGEAVVGRHGPLARSELGEPLFADTAHLFSVLVPAAEACRPATVDAIARVIDREKPAHTDHHLCIVGPRMRVGFQARVGIDSIVASGPLPLPLGEASLGADLVLGEFDEGAVPMRVGQYGVIGRDTALR